MLQFVSMGFRAPILLIFFLHVGYSLEGNVHAFIMTFSYVYETVDVMAAKDGTMHKTLLF